MDEEPELDTVDFSDTEAAAKYRQHVECHRAEARRRYHDYLAAAFDVHGAADPSTLADVALDALTLWRYVVDVELCRCSCHPRLPDPRS